MNMVTKLAEREALARGQAEQRHQTALLEALVAAQPHDTTRQRSGRDEERLLQGPGAVLSLRRAAELLPGSDKTNRAWLRDQDLVRCAPSGAEIVIWSEVLGRLAGGPSDQDRAEAIAAPKRGSSRLPRYDLGER